MGESDERHVKAINALRPRFIFELMNLFNSDFRYKNDKLTLERLKTMSLDQINELWKIINAMNVKGEYIAQAAQIMLNDFYMQRFRRIPVYPDILDILPVKVTAPDLAQLNQDKTSLFSILTQQTVLRKKYKLGKKVAPVGGIDLNELNLQTDGQANAIQMPSDPAMLKQPIQGLVPNILFIGEIGLYDFLGLNPADPDDHPDTSLAQKLSCFIAPKSSENSQFKLTA